MGKLIKYEIKGNYIKYSIIFILMAILNIFLYSRSGSWFSGTIFGLTMLVNFTAFVAVFLFNVNSFSKEVYEDRGYLTFTLPVSSNKLVASKIISSMIGFAATFIVSLIFGIITLKLILDGQVYDLIQDLFTFKISTTIIVGYAIYLLVLLITVYFSIAASKMTFKNRKIGKFIGFVVFIALNILISYIRYKLKDIFPQTISFELTSLTDTINQLKSLGVIVTIPKIQINIANIIYSIIVYISLFFGTSYIIENKIDL